MHQADGLSSSRYNLLHFIALPAVRQENLYCMLQKRLCVPRLIYGPYTALRLVRSGGVFTLRRANVMLSSDLQRDARQVPLGDSFTLL